MKKPIVALIGTLDTKAEEYSFLRSCIEKNGAEGLYIDAGIFEPGSNIKPEISAAEVAEAGGESLESLREKKNRGYGVDIMSRGLAVITKRLYDEGRIDGVIAMGGGGGTTLGTSAMRALPVGVPKVMVSTIASGDTSNYVGESDILMMPSIVDIAGINRFSSMILSNAAAAISGMVLHEKPVANEKRPLIAATMFGVTTPCVTHAKELLEQKGYEVLIFHAVGSGGKTMENLIREGHIQGLLDITTTELADELVGGILSAGPHRMEAAVEVGIPQVASAGALDMVNFGTMDSVPEKFKNRLLVPHNSMNTLMRTTVEENQELARIIAGKLNKAKGKTVFLIPLKGFSMMDADGGVFYNTDADNAFIDTLKENLNDRVEIVFIDANINNPSFSEKAVELLLKNL